MVGCHIAENIVEVGFGLQRFSDAGSLVESIFYGRYKLGLYAGDQSLEIHEILGESTGFIETAKTDIASNDNFIFLDTKYILLFEFTDRVNHPKGHTDRQRSRYSNSNQIQKRHNNICGAAGFQQLRDHSQEGEEGDHKKKKKKFS